MNRFDENVPILEHIQVADDHYKMRLASPNIAREVRPGQFVHVRVWDGLDPLLRRPLTVYRRFEESFEVLYQVIGRGTELLRRVSVGSSLRILGPLGNTFHIPEGIRLALVVGGGVGIASLALLVETLIARSIPTRVLVGAQTRARLVGVDDLRNLGANVHVATDDGSEGFHGLITELAKRFLRDEASGTVVYGCGPVPMMRALAQITSPDRIPTQLAFESHMGCALGVCLGCVIRVRAAGGTPQPQRVCTEGPIFDAEEIVW